MTDRLTIEQLRALPAKKKPKYGNRKVVYRGIQFDSIKERDRYLDLLLMEKAGHIAHLTRQVSFPLYVNGLLVCTYKCDFYYTDLKTGKLVVEDVKGFRNAFYKLKAKLFEAVRGFKILET